MLHLPYYEVIYYSNKLSYREVKEARKDIPSNYKFFSVAASILIGALIPSILSVFFPDISIKNIFSFLFIVVAYLMIFPINFCIPREWVIGSNAIYLPYVLKSKIEWNEIEEVKEAKHGFIITSRGICRKIYLVTEEKEKVASLLKSFAILNQ